MGLKLAWVSSDDYASNERKLIFDICFYLEVTIFLKSLKGLMPNQKCYTLEMKTVIEKNKLLICRWVIK